MQYNCYAYLIKQPRSQAFSREKEKEIGIHIFFKHACLRVPYIASIQGVCTMMNNTLGLIRRLH